ncbi:flavin-containing monooxygenase [Litorivivens sp.]|uniref:flavin-containing monooxygenase n=2 Tax=Litorivivens sp. TaxID=2020868 RepID=UPI0035639C94
MNTQRQNPSVVIIGAGMTGIGLAIKLKLAGINNITLLEKAGSVGGTWRENTYPGVACDVPSHAYTYSFAPNPDWSSFFAPGHEICAYFQSVFDRYALAEHTYFNEEVTRCHYERGRWQVETANDKHFEADFLFSATGFLHRPKYPEIPGLENFAGPKMHSARWDHSVELKRKKIGVIGTGSSATQIIPELIDTENTQVSVFQRTAQWIVHTDNKPYSESDKAKFRAKPSRIERVKNLSLYVFEQGTTALTSQSLFYRTMHKLFAWNAVRHLKQKVKNPELRKKLTPDYTFGCKRVVMNGRFYDAMQKPNAHLVTEKIAKVVPNGIVTADGQHHELDILVMATGFDSTAFMRPISLEGRDGITINDVWRKKMVAYRSMCLPGFPNFFLTLGPNSPVGNYSVIAISEKQADYAIQLINAWQSGTLETVEVKRSALDSWYAKLKGKLSHTIWASGCQSWYLDADGDPLTWPDSWKAWTHMMKTCNLDDFEHVSVQAQNDTETYSLAES